MAQRLDLQDVLVDLLQSRNVYFQPPENLQMAYPCMVYKRDSLKMEHANDFPYKRRVRYQITVIDRDPDSKIPSKVESLALCSFERFFTLNGLNHFVYNLYF